MKNTEKCAERLRALPANAREALLSARRAAADAALREAEALAPYRTGRLRASLTRREESGKNVLSAHVPYAAFVEMGTRRQSARPFLRPAADRCDYAGRAAYELRKAMK